jgi:hypothetical protein
LEHLHRKQEGIVSPQGQMYSMRHPKHTKQMY